MGPWHKQMLCTYFRIPFQLLPPYLQKLSICFHSSSSLLVFHLSYVEGRLSWHLLLISPQGNIMQTFIFDSLLQRASALEMRSNYFLCPWLLTKDQLEQGLFLSWYFPLTAIKVCWLIPVTDQTWYVLFMYLLFICLFVYLFIGNWMLSEEIVKCLNNHWA